MGRLSWIAGTAAFITLAWLLLAMTHLSKKEYTEEIERLRKDLSATREKNGVYMDKSEYARITAKLSALENENVEKCAHIRFLQEEMEKVEGLCSTLHMEVSEKNTELVEKTQILTEMEDCLEHTKSTLELTKFKKQISDQLVSYHETKEKELSEQAHSLLRVADQSTKDVSLLHDKLSKKRSIEEKNKNHGEEFRQKFQREMGDTESSLDKLISQHAEFCGNLRNTLGDMQQQKMLELTTMSELLTNQVKFFMDMLHHIEQISSDAMRDAQHWIQSHLGFVRLGATTDEELRASIIQQFESPLQSISEGLHTAVIELQSMSNEVNDKIREREYQLEVNSLETTEALNGIEEAVAQYVAQRKVESQRFATIQQNAVEDSMAEDRDMLLQLRVLIETAQRLEERTKARQQTTNKSDTEFNDHLSRTNTLMNSMVGEVQKKTGSLKKKLTKFESAGKKMSKELQQSFREFVEKQMVSVNHMGRLRDEAVGGCLSALNSHEEERRQYYQSTEEQLRDHSEMLKRHLQSEQEQTQVLATKMREMAEVQESHLESQRRSFRSFVLQRQDELEEECSVVREQGQVVSDELRKRQMELGNYFSNEYLSDQPTGNTPQRRAYIYPQKLVASSPKEVIIKRFKEKMDSVKELKPEIKSVHIQKKGALSRRSWSTSALSEEKLKLMDDLVSEKQDLAKAASDSEQVALDDSWSSSERENAENLPRKINRAGRGKYFRRVPRVKTKHRSLLREKNDG